MRKIHRHTLQHKLFALILIFWVLPLLATIFWFSMQQEENARSRMEEAVNSSMHYTMSSMEQVLTNAVQDSRQASYDNIVDTAYAAYCDTGNLVPLYGTTSTYLHGQYSYNPTFHGSVVAFWNMDDFIVYNPSKSTSNSGESAQRFRRDAEDVLLPIAYTLDTNFAFCDVDGQLYLIRNLVDNHFAPYATLILPFQTKNLLSEWETLLWVKSVSFQIDDTYLPTLGDHIPLEQDELTYDPQTSSFTMGLVSDIENHPLRLEACFVGSLMQTEREGFYNTLNTVVLVSGLLFALLVRYAYSNITEPMKKLLHGSAHLEQGNLGYQITDIPQGAEFYELTKRFNILSNRLKTLFDRNNQEQQALHDARIKALQSQINPHFLNNTLEMINWQARMSGDETVSDMISALSVMLNAAMARGGSSTVTLKEEMSYVEAYLFIISHRFGKRLTVTTDVDHSMDAVMVPRLILQPIVENAIEHGVARQPNGNIYLHIYPSANKLIIDVDHAGSISPADRATIDRLLQWDGTENNDKGATRIGIRNVQHRLKMVGGAGSGMTIEESPVGHVRTRIVMPLSKDSQT